MLSCYRDWKIIYNLAYILLSKYPLTGAVAGSLHEYGREQERSSLCQDDEEHHHHSQLEPSPDQGGEEERAWTRLHGPASIRTRSRPMLSTSSPLLYLA